MAFEAEEVAVQLIEALRPLVPRINIGEGNHSDPGNRRARFFTAAGSANETRLALRVVVAWGYCAAEQAEPAELLVKRIQSMLWKLTH